MHLWFFFTPVAAVGSTVSSPPATPTQEQQPMPCPPPLKPPPSPSPFTAMSVGRPGLPPHHTHTGSQGMPEMNAAVQQLIFSAAAQVSGAGRGGAGQGGAGRGRAGRGAAGWGRAGQGRAGQGGASCTEHDGDSLVVVGAEVWVIHARALGLPVTSHIHSHSFVYLPIPPCGTMQTTPLPHLFSALQTLIPSPLPFSLFQQNQAGRRSLDAATAHLKRMGLDTAGGGGGGGGGVTRAQLLDSNPAIVSARWGWGAGALPGVEGGNSVGARHYPLHVH